jgi:glycosyltransferase involved in cell wall biosynthesis
MKILFLLTQDLESPAGVGRYLPWAQELARLGYEVTIAALHANFAALDRTHFVSEGVEVNYVSQMHVLKQNNLKTYFPGRQLLGITATATQKLLSAAWKSNADIIQVGKPHPMNGTAALILRYLKRKIIFLDCDDFEMANIHFGAGWQKIGVHFFETMLPKHVDYVSVHTSFLREQVLQLGVKKERIIYLPHGADTHRFVTPDYIKTEKIREELGLAGKKVIVFIGSLSLPSHPVDILLDAFQQVHTTIPQSVLLIVGGGEEYDALVARAHWLGLKGAVIFRGRVPGADVPLYYSLANLSVEPVKDNPVGRSSLPLKMFESWAAGVPFITQDVGDRKLLIGDPPAGITAKAGDANSLADAILRVLGDSGLWQQLRQRGFEQAKKYSWENLARQMDIVYREVILRKYGHTV